MMINNNNIQSQNQQALSRDVDRPRKPYRKPKLEVLGDLRSMTLGASPAGVKDSGVGLYEKVAKAPIPGFPPLPDGFPNPGESTQP